jgi:hypothetical protein
MKKIMGCKGLRFSCRDRVNWLPCCRLCGCERIGLPARLARIPAAGVVAGAFGSHGKSFASLLVDGLRHA